MEIVPYPKDPRFGVTREGRVFRLRDPRAGRACPYELLPHAGKRGYLTVSVDHVTTPIHRLVAETFLPNPRGCREVAHNDGVRHNNRVENLRWATRKENNDDRHRHGTVLRGEELTIAKLNEEAVQDIKRRLASGREFHREIAADYGVSRRCVGKINLGESWRHVD